MRRGGRGDRDGRQISEHGEMVVIKETKGKEGGGG